MHFFSDRECIKLTLSHNEGEELRSPRERGTEMYFRRHHSIHIHEIIQSTDITIAKTTRTCTLRYQDRLATTAESTRTGTLPLFLV